MAAVRVVPAALPHLPAFSGVTWLKYCVNSGRVSSLTLPEPLVLPEHRERLSRSSGWNHQKRRGHDGRDRPSRQTGPVHYVPLLPKLV